MSKLKQRRDFREDFDLSDCQSTEKSKLNFGSEYKIMKKQIRFLQSEVKTLKKLSILSIFGSKANFVKFYQDIW